MPPTLTPACLHQGLLSLRVIEHSGGATREREDVVAVEEPVQIRLDGDPFATLMRTPGADVELTAGFLLAEGIIESLADLGSIAPCKAPVNGALRGEPLPSAVDVVAAAGTRFRWEPDAERSIQVSAACGVCGRASIDELVERCGPLVDDSRYSPRWIRQRTLELARHQFNFERTGGVHAAAFWNAAGELRAVREDVGRHNAVDKVVGRLLLDGELPATGGALAVSGRVGFEIVQKAVAARIPLVVSVSAPSSLAVQLARRSQLTLISFARGERFNVYAGAERVQS